MTSKHSEMISRGESVFTGGFWGMIGVNLAVSLVSAISLGFAYPAMYCWMQRWYWEHTYIDGKQMTFDGRGGQLFGKYLLWCLLLVVTFGIYGLWLPLQWQRWVTKHVHCVEKPAAPAYIPAAPAYEHPTYTPPVAEPAPVYTPPVAEPAPVYVPPVEPVKPAGGKFCANCGADVSAGYAFCWNCGTPVGAAPAPAPAPANDRNAVCPHCGARQSSSAVNCKYCGTPMR